MPLSANGLYLVYYMCQIAGLEETPKSNRLYWKRPMCVLIERNFLDSSVTSIW